MTATSHLDFRHRTHRKRKFHVRKQSLGVGFESFDVAAFRVENVVTKRDLTREPEPIQYLTGWFTFVLWMLLVGLLVLNWDLLLAFVWLLLGRHL
jgi:hypothetical protein